MDFYYLWWFQTFWIVEIYEKLLCGQKYVDSPKSKRYNDVSKFIWSIDVQDSMAFVHFLKFVTPNDLKKEIYKLDRFLEAEIYKVV